MTPLTPATPISTRLPDAGSDDEETGDVLEEAPPRAANGAANGATNGATNGTAHAHGSTNGSAASTDVPTMAATAEELLD
jgi:hypothetical protein